MKQSISQTNNNGDYYLSRIRELDILLFHIELDKSLR